MTKPAIIVILVVGSIVLAIAFLAAKATAFIAGGTARERRTSFIKGFVWALIVEGLVLAALVQGMRNTHWAL